MNLEQSIHQRWATRGELDALLPASRLSTGGSSSGVLPCAVLSRTRTRRFLRANTGESLDEVALRIDVYHETYDAGRAVVDLVLAAFDGSRFDLAGGGRVLRMRRSNEVYTRLADGTWLFTLEYIVRVWG